MNDMIGGIVSATMRNCADINEHFHARLESLKIRALGQRRCRRFAVGVERIPTHVGSASYVSFLLSGPRLIYSQTRCPTGNGSRGGSVGPTDIPTDIPTEVVH